MTGKQQSSRQYTGELTPEREYPDGSGIVIAVRPNQKNGDITGFSHFVTVPAALTGQKRIRRQFSKVEEAEEYADGFLKQRGTGDLSVRELAEAQTQMARLRDAGMTLTAAVDYALGNMPRNGSKTFKEVYVILLSSRSAHLRKRSIRDFKERGKKLCDEFGDRPIDSIETGEFITWVRSLKLGPKSNTHYRGTASAIFGYAVECGWRTRNPIKAIPTAVKRELFKVPKPKVEILTPEEALRLIMTAAEHPDIGLLPSIILGLFAGIRTSEARQLSWSDIDWDEKRLIIPAAISKVGSKTEMDREVPLSDQCLAWLRLCPQQEGRLYPRSLKTSENDWVKLLRRAGFAGTTKGKRWVKFPHNGMRHSFASYHYRLYGDAYKTAQLIGHGNGISVFEKHYKRVAKIADAEEYFKILPPKALQLVSA